MSGAYYGNQPDYRYDSRDSRDMRDPRDPRDPRDRERSSRVWESRDRPRGRGGPGGGGPPDFENYGRLREDDYTPNGTRRVRSPGPPPRRRPARSRSPPNIDRYTPGSGAGGGGGSGGGSGPGAGNGGPPGRYNSGDVYIPGASAPQGMSGGGAHPMARQDPIDRYVPGNLQAGGAPPNNNMLAPILLDPHNFDYLVPFTYFSDWFHGTPASAPSKAKYGEDMTMKDRYDLYKEGLPGRIAKIFVKNHKDSEWFKEKYLANDTETWKINMKQWRKNQWHVWSKELGSGKWDNWMADAKEGTKFNQIINTHSNEKPDNAATEEKEEKENGEEDDEAEDGAVDETPATNNGNTTLHDDALDRPALLIKTVSPTVKRGKLQELASSVEGFQYLSLGDPNPLKKFHRIGWIMVDPAIATESSLETAAALLNEERIHDEEKGDFVVHVGVHNPPKILTRKMLHDVMSLPREIISEVDRIREVVLKFERKLNDDEHDAIMEDNGEDVTCHGWDLIIAKVDEIMAKKLAEKAQDEPEEEPEDGEAEDDKPSDEEVERAKRTIDIAVEYLRRVFSFCYYCFTEADSIHELVRRCPGGHIRRPLPPPPTSGDVAEKPLHPASEKWAKNLRDKISLFLNPESADLKKLGGQDVESAVYEEVAKYIKQEDEGKFRCRVKDCTKLFKSEVFVRKHVEKRHADFVEGLEQEATLVNAYALDPFRIMPPKENANQPNAGGPGGGPMGGNFQMRQNTNFDPSRNFMGSYGIYPPFPDGGYPGGGGVMHNPANVDRYTPGGGRGRPDLMAGNIGPMRRRPMGTMHMTRGNPYMRPPMMSNRERLEREREREGRFQAAMAGATAVAAAINSQAAAAATKDGESAAGRSLKSYMDLDAANSGNSKVDELDY